MADIFKDTFRESDIIARMGGDEFAVLLIDTAEKNIAVIKSRLQANIDAFNKTGKASYRLSISSGVVIYNHERPRSIDDLLKEADELMYEEKERKREADSSRAGKTGT
jgi:diguanylate cyclase (GGDEF)-like protein